MFDRTKISSVYSGRKGCACGCRGKYAYADAHRADRPSYCEGDEWVSDRTVKTIANKVEQFLRAGTDVEHVMVDEGGGWIAVDLYHDRTYTLYFQEAA